MKKTTPKILKALRAKRKKLQKSLIAKQKQWRKKPVVIRAQKLIQKHWFGRAYTIVALVVLAASSSFWSLLGGRLQAGNADQLINSFLFQNGATLHGAVLPGAHSFLLKWPLFWLISLQHYSLNAFLAATVGCVLLTLALFAFILYRLDRRPLVFGTLCLVLASVLMMVPAQAYPGALLPVNMAMLATRNLEYALFIASLALLVQVRNLKSWRAWLSIALLGVVIASDKLFLTLSVGGALLALIGYAIFQRTRYVNLATRWLVAGLSATVLGLVLIHIINVSGLATISGGTSPYALVTGLKELLLGSLYAIAGLFTNFGANPAYQETVVRHLPSATLHGLWSAGGIVYLLNAVVLIFGVVGLVKQFIKTFGPAAAGKQKTMAGANYLLLLSWCSVVAVLAFVASDHYYAVDARYLTIVLFAVFASLAFRARTSIKQPGTRLVAIGIIMLMATGLGSLTALHNYHKGITAGADFDHRNQLVLQAFQHHPESVLVGDYWRVLPIKVLSNQSHIMPLADCLNPRGGLTSTNWQTNLQHHSFAYLLSLDKAQTNFPSCSLAQITAAYGFPDSSAVIAGKVSNPTELILFYNHGSHPSALVPNSQLNQPATVVPVELSDLTHTTCRVPTDVNIVAHQDDDLLFMNPDILHAIKEGHCERTIYVTAGDAGHGLFYWLERQRGSEAAYDKMIGSNADWTERVVKVAPTAYATIATPKGNYNISLVFLHLPDGNLLGQGFGPSNYQSLAHLNNGSLRSIEAIDGQSSYTRSQLIDTLTSLLQTYQPALIRTQAPYSANETFPDHSDHITVGQLAAAAHLQYQQSQFGGIVSIPLSSYVGYPVHALPPNVAGSDLDAKQDIFFRYSQFDGSVCHTMAQCREAGTYSAYLDHEYTTDLAH